MAKRQSKTLTDAHLGAWVATGAPIAKSDGDGLTFTLSDAGQATCVLRYGIGGRRRELTLGRYPDMKLAEARKRATAERMQVGDGVDVAAEKRRARRASVAAWTVRQLANDYDEKTLAHAAVSTRKLYGSYLNNWVRPRLGAMLVRDVATADIVAMLRAAAARGTGAMRTLHAVTRAVFEHAHGQAIRDDNPATGVKRGTISKAMPARKGTALGGDALAAFLRAIPNDVKGWALSLHLMTGVRPAELCQTPWCEFDLDAGTWAVDGARVKTRDGYVISLPVQAVELLREIKAATVASAFVFPAVRGEDRPIPYQTYRAWLWRAVDAAGMDRKSFKPHDLRRTMRSGLATLGIRFEVAERAINHKLPGMTEIYDRNDYATARKAALAQWAGYLDGLRSGANIVPIKRNVG